MRKLIFVQLVIFLFCLLMLPSGQAMVIEKILAKVNGQAITSSTVNAELMAVRYRLSQEGKSPEEIEKIIPVQRAVIIDRLIEDIIILEAAHAKRYDVPEERINLEVNKQVEMTKSRFPSEDIFFKELKKEGKNLNELKKDYRKEITNELLRQEIVRNEITSKIDTTDNNVRDYYNQKFYRVHARHILVKTREEAMNLFYQLKDGADFAVLAQKHSLDPSASEGGDLGFFPRGVMIQGFEEVAFSLEKNTFSQPVKTPFGYHLIKVEEIEQAKDVKPLSDDELTALRKEYYNKELRYRYDQWINDLKEAAVIEIMDEALKK